MLCKEVYELFFNPGEVVEIRILNVYGTSALWNHKHAQGIVSGYFDNYEDFFTTVCVAISNHHWIGHSITSAALTDRNDISYMSFQDIHDNPVEMEPLINGFLYKNESCLIHAPGGVGKSLIVLYISLYLASYGTDETSNNVSALYKRRAY